MLHKGTKLISPGQDYRGIKEAEAKLRALLANYIFMTNQTFTEKVKYRNENSRTRRQPQEPTKC